MDKSINVPVWMQVTGFCIVAVVVCISIIVSIWRTHVSHKQGQELQIYEIPTPYANNVKIILQMLIGIGTTCIIVLKMLNHLGIHFSIDFLKNFVYNLKTLEIVGLALAYASALELAYTLFTPGPDEAVDPLITGLAAGILLGISQISNLNVTDAGGIVLYVLALGGLFVIRYFFIQDKFGELFRKYKSHDMTSSEASKSLNPVLVSKDGERQETQAISTGQPILSSSVVQAKEKRVVHAKKQSILLGLGVLLISIFGMRMFYRRPSTRGQHIPSGRYVNRR